MAHMSEKLQESFKMSQGMAHNSEGQFSEMSQLAEQHVFMDGVPMNLVYLDDRGCAVYCPDCQMWLNGPTQWQRHKTGKKHRKHVA